MIRAAAVVLVWVWALVWGWGSFRDEAGASMLDAWSTRNRQATQKGA